MAGKDGCSVYSEFLKETIIRSKVHGYLPKNMEDKEWCVRINVLDKILLLMTDYFIWVILVSLWCFGFHNAFEEGQIFGKIGDYLYKKFPEFWLKPFIGCPICLPSVHGTIWFLITQEWHFLTWIMFIVAASGLNYVIHNLFPKNDRSL